jgi:branched-subunit amino acid aminotransferase/4-amino-4-deoxychorismate lyase
VWLSGKFLPAEQAGIPASSRALLLGVGLYETLRVTGGAAPLLDLHLERLRSSARDAGLELPALDWAGAVEELARRNALSEARVRLTLGDGFALLTCAPLPAELAHEREHGVRLRTCVLERTCAAVKSCSRFDLEMAERAGGGEVLLRARDGRALETTRANFFAVVGEELLTAAPPAVLPGIARQLVIELARGRGAQVRECAPSLAESSRWSEAFLTSALRGVRAVAAIDDRDLPERPGAWTQALRAALVEGWGIG